MHIADAQMAALAAKARAKSLSTEEYARQVVEQDLATDWLQRSWESSSHQGLDQLSRMKATPKSRRHAEHAGMPRGISRVGETARWFWVVRPTDSVAIASR